MMNARHILLIDPHRKSRSKAHFLLNLAQCRVSSFGYFDEATNWLTCLTCQEEQVDQILIKNASLFDDLLGHLRTIGGLATGLPILFTVGTGEDLAAVQGALNANLHLRIAWCPEDQFRDHIAKNQPLRHGLRDH